MDFLMRDWSLSRFFYWQTTTTPTCFEGHQLFHETSEKIKPTIRYDRRV